MKAMNSKPKNYKYCLVPQCRNTTVTVPNKIFIGLPNGKRRIEWLKACRRDKNDISVKSKGVYVCEDHFNLEKDMENYIRFKLMGGVKIMKPDVVPHRFDWQLDSTAENEVTSNSISITEILKSVQNDSNDVTDSKDLELNMVQKKNVSTQSHPKFRSKYIQCKLKCNVDDSVTPSAISNQEVQTSSVLLLYQSSGFKTRKVSTSGSSQNEYIGEKYSFSYNENDCQSSDDELQDMEEIKKEYKSLSLKCTIQKLQKRPKLYMGLPDYAFYIFQLLEKYCKLKSIYIFLTLKKIKTGDSFMSLADDFGTNESNALRIFVIALPILSKYLRKCIIKLEINFVKSNLPLAFQAQYRNIFSIINCLEIKIEMPSDIVKQSLTWSDYKKCNSLKYLISYTPDGIIHFISKAFGGRTSDAAIMQHSGFLDILPPKVAIMADRNLKNIEPLLTNRGCVLIRPPSVSPNVKFIKTKVLATKHIASVRFHVERVLHRLKEFACFAPHVCIGNNLIPYMDDITQIACGLINLQTTLI